MGRRNRRKNKKRKEVRKVEQEKSLSLSDMAPELVINKDVYQKVMYWVDRADTEVSGLGAIEIIDGVPTVIDVILLDQECTGVETELDPEAICKALYAYEKSGKPGDIRWWWHSHVNMDVFWSGTDYAAIEQLGKSGWFLSTVFNKKRELRTAFYGTSPMKLFVDSIMTTIHQQIPQELINAWDLEFKEKVKKPVSVYHGGYLGGYSSGEIIHPAAKDFSVVPLTSQEELIYDEDRYFLVTTGLLPKMVSEIDDLRTHGWNDKEIGSYFEIEDHLVDRWLLEKEEDDSQEIEELRKAGVSETDIFEMLKQTRGRSHAI